MHVLQVPMHIIKRGNHWESCHSFCITHETEVVYSSTARRLPLFHGTGGGGGTELYVVGWLVAAARDFPSHVSHRTGTTTVGGVEGGAPRLGPTSVSHAAGRAYLSWRITYTIDTPSSTVSAANQSIVCTRVCALIILGQKSPSEISLHGIS